LAQGRQTVNTERRRFDVYANKTKLDENLKEVSKRNLDLSKIKRKRLIDPDYRSKRKYTLLIIL
jgi:hypothetical protein